MKITFIYPRFKKFLNNNPELDEGLVEYFLGDFTTPPSLGIPILAALTPPDIAVELIDDNAGDPVNFAEGGDLIAINCFTPQATRAFELADGYRAAGKNVIMGGFFPSFMPGECLKHADSVNIGEGEPVWPQIVADARNGRLERRYKGGCRMNLADLPIPRRELFYDKHSYDWDEDLVQLTRGCVYNCAMCAIPAHMGQRMRFRPIEHVVEEIRGLKFENVYLADDSLFFPQRKIADYAIRLLEALAPLNKKYFVSSTVALNAEPAFLDLMARAGVANFYCTMNVDPVSIRALQGSAQEQRQIIDLVKKLEDRGIRFFGSCALGRDWDDESIADRILELFDRARIRTSEFFIFTPYPGSVHWDRLERQGRIIDRDWSRYNGAHVVFEPMNMSRDRLYEQFIKVWNEFFRAQKKQHAAHLEPATWKDGKQIVGKPLQRKGVRGQAVVTGIGILSPIGNDTAAITRALREAKHGLAPATRFDASHFRTDLVGEIRDFQPERHMTCAEIEEYDDRYLQYAIVAARKALADAGVKPGESCAANRIALVLGTCNGGLLSAEAEYRWKHGKADKPFDEKMNLQAQYYGFGKAMAAALGITAEAWIVTTACSSTTGALGLAQALIQREYFDAVLVGGADSLCVANMSGFDGLKAVASGQTAPFSTPVGLNVGEAACFWVVEEMEKALLKNARCYGKIAGHATSSDAYHPTSPDPRGDGVYRTIRDALAHANLDCDALGCINAHGTGTEANDRAESKGIARVIGERPIPVVSTKSFFGHCMGTTGILEATCNLVAMNAGFIPPTVNFSGPRPGCSLDYAPNEAREKTYQAFVSANYAFGGNNAAVVITRWDYPLEPAPRRSRRVAITGCGLVSALGLGVERTLEALRAGLIGIAPAVKTLGLEGMRSRCAGLVQDFRASDIDRRLDFSGMNKISKMATAAARLALAHAGLRVSPRNAEQFGLAVGVCNGPPESGHMDSVFSSDSYAPDIGSFSNITANSTAGWISNALCLKGANLTLAPGPHAGIQALAYAFDCIAQGRAERMIAGAADELYAQTYYNYDLMRFLYEGDDEVAYRLRPEHAKRKVLGEGAAMLALESWDAATERGAPILAELLGYGMRMDGGGFSEQNLQTRGMVDAAGLALSRAGVDHAAIDLIVWAPQGNAQDWKVLDALRELFGDAATRIPFLTTTFNTGYIESASALVSLGATLASLVDQTRGWPQLTGIESLDRRPVSPGPKTVLLLAGVDLGYNFAALFRSRN